MKTNLLTYTINQAIQLRKEITNYKYEKEFLNGSYHKNEISVNQAKQYLN